MRLRWDSSYFSNGWGEGVNVRRIFMRWLPWTAFAIALFALELVREIDSLRTVTGPSKFVFLSPEQGTPRFVKATGSWHVTNGGEQLMLHTVSITCQLAEQSCSEVTANVYESSMSIVDAQYEIKEWSPSVIVYENTAPICAEYVTTIDLAQKRVFALRKLKDALPEGAACAGVEPRIEMELQDGFDVGRITYNKRINEGFFPLIKLLTRIFN